MCRPVACRQCGKMTWAGCGQHVDEVLRRIPRDSQCQGHTDGEMRMLRLFGR